MTIDTANMHRGATVAKCPRMRPMFTLRINKHSYHSATSARPKIPTLSVHRDVLPTPTEPPLTNSDVISTTNTGVTQFQHMLVVLIILGVERDNATQQCSQQTKHNTNPLHLSNGQPTATRIKHFFISLGCRAARRHHSNDTTPTMQPMSQMHNVSKNRTPTKHPWCAKTKASKNFATEHVLQKRRIASNTQVTSAVSKKYGVANVPTQSKENERTRVNMLVKSVSVK